MLQIEHKTESKRDYYELLGVTRTASPREIRRNLSMLLMQVHPDHGGRDREAFDILLEAQEMLLHKVNRKIYDQTGLLKSDLDGIAEEFAAKLLELYIAGHRRNKIMKKVLVEDYSRMLKEQEDQVKITEKVIVDLGKLLDELEPESLFDKGIYGSLEKKRREQKAVLIEMNKNVKQFNAYVILAQSIGMKVQVEDPPVVKTADGSFTVTITPKSGPSFFSFR